MKHKFNIALVNCISAVRLVMSPFIVPLIYSGFWTLALALIVIGITTDLYDGALARGLQAVTRFGTRLDMLADRALLISILLGIALRGAIPVWLFGVLVVGLFISDFISHKLGYVGIHQMVYWWIYEGTIVYGILRETSFGFVIFWLLLIALLSVPMLFFEVKRERAKDWIRRFKKLLLPRR